MKTNGLMIAVMAGPEADKAKVEEMKKKLKELAGETSKPAEKKTK